MKRAPRRIPFCYFHQRVTPFNGSQRTKETEFALIYTRAKGGWGGGEKKSDYKIASQFSKFRVSITLQSASTTNYHHHHNLLYFANLGMSPKLVALPWRFKHASSRGYKYSASNTLPLLRTSTLYQTPALSWVEVLSQTLVVTRVQVLSIKRSSLLGTSTLSQTPVLSRVQVLSQTLVLLWVQELSPPAILFSKQTLSINTSL